MDKELLIKLNEFVSDEDMPTVEKLLDHHISKAVIEAEEKLWREILRKDGLSSNSEGLIEIHPDYIEERIAELKVKQELSHE